MPVLMMDVARRAGVSVTTVSHVMNETRGIAPGTRARVLKAIKQLNYYKNTSARLLVRGQSDVVGLIISDIENPFVPPLVKSFERACAAAGFELLLGMTNYEQGKAETAVRRMIESRVRGVAVMTSQIDGRLVETLVGAGVAVVALDLPRIGRGKSKLSIDYTAGVLEAIEHLYVSGHRRVSVIEGPATIVSACRYAEALRTSIGEYGMTLVRAIEAGGSPENGAEAATRLLEAKHPPTALLCRNDLTAIGALGAAARLGIRIPTELSVIGSDDILMASYSHPPLSTVRISRDAIGHEAFRLLEGMCGAELRRGTEARIATSFVARESSGALGRGRQAHSLADDSDRADLRLVTVTSRKLRKRSKAG